MIIRKVPINKINPASYNPRKDLKPDNSEYQKLLRSIDEFGYVDPLIWNKRTGNLVGGHQRFKILLAKGIAEIEVSVVDLPLEKEKTLNVALNKISGQWDKDKLASLLDELCQMPDFDIELTGFDMPEIENLVADTLNGLESEEDFDVDAELSKDLPTITKSGDIIELGLHGEHRLICGDVTKPADVAALLGKFRCQLCHTDPPYGVGYDRRNRPTSKTQKEKIDPAQARSMKLQNDDLTPQRYRRWFSKVADAINEAIVPGAAYYIWNSHKNFGLMHDLLSELNFKISCVITWAKESFSPNFSDYNQQVEFCLYGWKGGARHNWYGPKNESTLWDIHRDRTSLYRHPTQKALELAERAIRNSSKYGDIVFDPFLGSGTSLIAAARLGRRCFGIEIEPKYCDCIVRRYIALAGKDSVPKEVAQRYCAEGVVI
ncbi:MAG: DNA modification methylase [Planctomycetes bacterium]|nr:DNA modification methylase [Planctomycetota bacterium]